LRFPGLAAEYGGGAFMLPYFAALLILGIPLSWAEWTMGRYGGIRGFNSAPGIFSVIWRNQAAKYCGAIALLIPLIIYMYYVLIESWCLSYAISYITGDLMSGSGGRLDQIIGEVRQTGAALTEQEILTRAYDLFFKSMTGSANDGAAFNEGRWVAVLVLVFALNFACIYRGLSKALKSFAILECRFCSFFPLRCCFGF
jgi:neurotransmitter:Na+ symporter, NSS family